MRRRAWTWLALSSFAFVMRPSLAATRPRYGGTLTLQLTTADGTEGLPDRLANLVADTLVRMNHRGSPEPRLAIYWQRDAEGKHWRFSLRPGVLLQDGKPLNAAVAAAALRDPLKKRYGAVTAGGSGQTLIIQSADGMDDLLAELSLPREGLTGTGPFRLTQWEPNRKAVLTAFEDYWDGRPFLDSIMINIGPLPRQLSVDTTGIWELPIGSARRVLPEGVRAWASVPMELVALDASGVIPSAREALTLSIDRAPIVNVLAQKRGEAAWSLLPQWLTGYAFLFTSAPDEARAKRILSSVKAGPLTISYAPEDRFARAVAERVSLNARDVGLNIEPGAGPKANLKVVRIALRSTDAALDLGEFGRQAGTPLSHEPRGLYEAERALIEERHIIPLIYLPRVYAIGPRVHNWDASQDGRAGTLHLENVWVSP